MDQRFNARRCVCLQPHALATARTPRHMVNRAANCTWGPAANLGAWPEFDPDSAEFGRVRPAFGRMWASIGLRSKRLQGPVPERCLSNAARDGERPRSLRQSPTMEKSAGRTTPLSRSPPMSLVMARNSRAAARPTRRGRRQAAKRSGRARINLSRAPPDILTNSPDMRNAALQRAATLRVLASRRSSSPDGIASTHRSSAEVARSNVAAGVRLKAHTPTPTPRLPPGAPDNACEHQAALDLPPARTQRA